MKKWIKKKKMESSSYNLSEYINLIYRKGIHVYYLCVQLYIILIRPERNVRPTVRAGRPNPTKSSAITATNASSMMGPVTATTVLTAATCDQNKAIKKHIASTMDCSTQSECKYGPRALRSIPR